MQLFSAKRWLVLLVTGFFLPVAGAAEESESPLWTDTIRSAEGDFAVSIDPQTKSAHIIRFDEREGPSPQLRVKILREIGGELEIRLRSLAKPEPPLRYAGRNEEWGGEITGFRVERSFDGKSWSALVSGKRPLKASARGK